jgi:hypothetical protein
LGVTYGVAQLPQTEGLRHTSASDRALGLDRGGPGQPVFASAFAVTVGGESLTVRMLVGVPAWSGRCTWSSLRRDGR